MRKQWLTKKILIAVMTGVCLSAMPVTGLAAEGVLNLDSSSISDLKDAHEL